MLGSHLLSYAQKTKFELLTPNRKELDLSDINATRIYLRASKPDAIIHAAAIVGGISANIRNPWEFLTKNIQIDSNLLLSAFEMNISKLIYIGSSCMYPKNTGHPLKEVEILSGPLEETNEGYALAKVVGTRTVQAAAKSAGLCWKTIILSNLYGPNDHFDEDRSHLLAAIIKKVHWAVQNNLDSVEMWGDGTARREFTFVNDAAAFIINTLETLHTLPNILNVGAGVDYTIEDYYRMVIAIFGFNGALVPNLEKPTGMTRKLMNVSLAAEFGWQGGTSITEGLEKTVKWFLQNYKVAIN